LLGLASSGQALDITNIDMAKIERAEIEMAKIEMANNDVAKQSLLAIATVLAIGATIAECRAASGLRLTCSGNLTNTREDGLTLGQCDLNFLPVKDINAIEDICGTPGTIDTPSETKCRMRAIVSPQTSRAADHRELYRVLDVLTVDKR
jgi:hypothetical protein